MRTNCIRDTEITASQLAEILDAEYEGPDLTVDGFASLEGAGTSDLAFCMFEDSDLVEATSAGIVLCLPSITSVDTVDKALVKSRYPRLDFKRAVRKCFVQPVEETIIHPSAVVEEGASVGNACLIGPSSYINECVTIGDGCEVLPGAVIGCTGNAFEPTDTGKMYNHVHVGEVVIGDDVFIGANCAIDRAVFGATRIGDGTVLHDLTHVAHNVIVGGDAWINQGCTLAGSVEVGDRVRIHPHVSVATNTRIGDDAEIGMNSTVLDDVASGSTVVGTPAVPIQ